ncbi:MAG: DUF5993 family protein [Gammaproteobacteria bacterium]|nr:DUF5993 family protein [Gammaproteobacteria bacterium]
MSLIFLLIALALLALMKEKIKPAYILFSSSFLLSLFWFNHHATSSLTIVL